jgi:hypothetical protein
MVLTPPGPDGVVVGFSGVCAAGGDAAFSCDGSPKYMMDETIKIEAATSTMIRVLITSQWGMYV